MKPLAIYHFFSPSCWVGLCVYFGVLKARSFVDTELAKSSWRFPIPQTSHQPDAATPTSLFLAAPHVLPQIHLVFLRVLLHITMGKQVVGEGHSNRIPTGSCIQVPEISAVSESWLLVYQGDSVWGFLQASAFPQLILSSALEETKSA